MLLNTRVQLLTIFSTSYDAFLNSSSSGCLPSITLNNFSLWSFEVIPNSVSRISSFKSYRSAPDISSQIKASLYFARRRISSKSIT